VYQNRSNRRGIRPNMDLTHDQHQKRIRERAVNRMISHAAWAGRRLARQAELSANASQGHATMLEMLEYQRWTRELLLEKYLVHPALVAYATRVAVAKVKLVREKRGLENN
jgi:hypothetical protein